MSGDLLVALGGGRVIDATKALAAVAGPPVRAAAIPTMLSAAEMARATATRRARRRARAHVRPAIVHQLPGAVGLRSRSTSSPRARRPARPCGRGRGDGERLARAGPRRRTRRSG